MSELAEKYRQRIQSLSPINSLSDAYQEQLIQQSDILKFKKKEFVFRQGDKDPYAFYVLEGNLEMIADDQLIKEVEGGTPSAVNALAQLQPRQLSAKAATTCIVLRLNRDMLDRLLSVESEPTEIEVQEHDTAQDDAEDGDWLGRLLQSELFNRVPPSNIQQLLNSLEPFSAEAGEAIINQGDQGEYYYVLQSGRCEVVRKGSKPGSEVKLAELGPGDNFGEEALVSGSKRNASVRMMTDGELVRLTKEDFVNLIKKPVLNGVSAEEAAKLVEQGAIYVDVRQPSEFEENGFKAAVNLPLNKLRTNAGKLDTDRAYIVYCDTGGRSSTAAFLLTEQGLDVHFVTGGCVDPSRQPLPKPKPKPAAEKAKPQAKAPAEPKPEPQATEPPKETKAQTSAAASEPAPEPEAAPAPAEASPDEQQRNASLEADIRASALTAQLAKANFELEEAKRIKAEAEQQRLLAEKLVKEQLAAERAKLEQHAKRAELMLKEAQQMRTQLETEKREAEEEVERHRRAEEEKIEKMKQEAEQRLKAEEARLEQVYQRNANELEKLQQQRAEAEAKLKAERDAMVADAAATKKRLDEAMAKERALEAEAQKIAAVQEAREKEMREAAQSALNSERRKLEAEFARTQAELQRARAERESAQAARKAAAEEAEAIIEEFKREHEQIRSAELSKLEGERKRLKAEADKMSTAVSEARKVQREAENAKAEALMKQKELQAAQEAAQADAASREEQARMAAEIAIIEQRAAAANKQLEDAERAQEHVREQQATTESELVRTYEGSGDLDPKLAEELEEWLAEQDKLQESTLERDKLKENAEITARINAQARKAREQSKDHTQSLLDELAEQLGEDEA